MCLTKKQRRAIVEIILGLFGMSTPDIFEKIFKEMWNAGNKWAIIGWITAIFIGLISFLDGIVTLAGYKNLGEFIFQDEDE